MIRDEASYKGMTQDLVKEESRIKEKIKYIEQLKQNRELREKPNVFKQRKKAPFETYET